MNNGKRTLFDRFGLSAKKSNQPSGEKHHGEFLQVVEHFVDSVGRPISRDDITAKHGSFAKLDGYIRALRNQGMIESSADNPNQFELTLEGRQWVQSLFPSSKFATRQWKKSKAKDKKHLADSKSDSHKPSNGKPKRRKASRKGLGDPPNKTSDSTASRSGLDSPGRAIESRINGTSPAKDQGSGPVPPGR